MSREVKLNSAENLLLSCSAPRKRKMQTHGVNLMRAVDDKAIIGFLRKSYFSADGIWFLSVEDEHSFEDALHLDERVWELMPKVQIRRVREILEIEDDSFDALAAGLELKFAAEGYRWEILRPTPEAMHIRIHSCPWLEILRRADRAHHAEKICDRICAKNLVAWGEKLGGNLSFSVKSKMSVGDSACEMLYTNSPQETTE